jgi:hypothetical protein
MALDMQPGKQFLDPQPQVGPEILSGCLDLSLKAREGSLLWFLLTILQS